MHALQSIPELSVWKRVDGHSAPSSRSHKLHPPHHHHHHHHQPTHPHIPARGCHSPLKTRVLSFLSFLHYFSNFPTACPPKGEKNYDTCWPGTSSRMACVGATPTQSWSIFFFDGPLYAASDGAAAFAAATRSGRLARADTTVGELGGWHFLVLRVPAAIQSLLPALPSFFTFCCHLFYLRSAHLLIETSLHFSWQEGRAAQQPFWVPRAADVTSLLNALRRSAWRNASNR